jgi:hypothetical protein
MRKINAMMILAILGWSVAAAALEPPRVVELTDGSVPIGGGVWSMDSKKIFFCSTDGTYFIDAVEGAVPQRIVDIPLGNLHCLSDTMFIGTRLELDRNYRPAKRIWETYRFTLGGDVKLLTRSTTMQDPFRTSSGVVWYDSAGSLVSSRTENGHIAAAVEDEFKLINHFPRQETNGIPLYEDTDLWLAAPNGTLIMRPLPDTNFHYAKLTSSGDAIVGKTMNNNILVIDFNGNIKMNITPEFPDIRDSLASWVADPDLSPDGRLLIYTRGYDNVVKQSSTVANLLIYDISTAQEIRVTDGNEIDYENPRFSPDGTKAVCTASNRLYLITLDMGEGKGE